MYFVNMKFKGKTEVLDKVFMWNIIEEGFEGFFVNLKFSISMNKIN